MSLSLAARPVRVFALCITFALCTAALAGCSSDIPKSERAAEFGDTVISEQEVTDYTAQFRQSQGYESDISWSLYLGSQELTGSTWREEAIRALATEELVKQRASELEITADESTVDASVETLKSSLGISDDSAWKEYLDSKNTTEEELRETYAFSNIEQQVITKDCDIENNTTDEDVQSYIESNLLDVVTRRYSVISFESDKKDEAKAALAKLKNAKAQRVAEFDKIMKQQESKASELPQGDLGWDFAYALPESMSGDERIKLQVNDLYGSLVTSDDYLQIYLCTGRFVFDGKTAYSKIEDAKLKQQLKTAAAASTWSATANTYLNELVDKADITVYEMPAGLPYDLTPYTEYSQAASAYGE